MTNVSSSSWYTMVGFFWYNVSSIICRPSNHREPQIFWQPSILFSDYTIPGALHILPHPFRYISWLTSNISFLQSRHLFVFPLHYLRVTPFSEYWHCHCLIEFQMRFFPGLAFQSFIALHYTNYTLFFLWIWLIL